MESDKYVNMEFDELWNLGEYDIIVFWMFSVVGLSFLVGIILGVIMVIWQDVLVVERNVVLFVLWKIGRIMGNYGLIFGVIGGIFVFMEVVFVFIWGKKDIWNFVIGGVVVGSIFGF